MNARTSAPRLIASNKCTSIIHEVIWLGGSIVSVGVRHVKVWRPEPAFSPSPQKSSHRSDVTDLTVPPSPSSKTLAGRNTLLGSLLEATFTCIAVVSNHKAITCTDGGDVMVLDDSGGAQQLHKVTKVDYSVKCLTVDSAREVVWIGGDKGEVQRLPYNALSAVELVEERHEPSNVCASYILPESSVPASLGMVRDRLLSIDSQRNIRIYDGLEEEDRLTVSRSSRAHSSAVLGVNILMTVDCEPTGFISWDTKGLVIFWTLSGNFEAFAEVYLDQLPSNGEIEPNELRVVRPFIGSSFFVSGDRYGTLRLVL